MSDESAIDLFKLANECSFNLLTGVPQLIRESPVKEIVYIEKSGFVPSSEYKEEHRNHHKKRESITLTLKRSK